MAGTPLVSFIVLSYNYENYIGATIRSILDQTVGDFEIVVVDDASKDRSCEVIRSFGDTRIRLYVNEQNVGGAASLNRAIELARGNFLVNLDADDWIAPRKTATQLAAFKRDPSLDIVGTYVTFVDSAGQNHPRAEELEAWTNQKDDLNQIDIWIGQNRLCRSSTMLRRSVHERIGLDDSHMVRAPDYELWTRALREGCRFGVIPEPLTFLRVHSRNVTYGDPCGTFREICFSMLKNIVPLIEKQAALASLARIIAWIAGHEQFAYMLPSERYRLMGLFLMPSPPESFSRFEELISDDETLPELSVAGRRCLVLCVTDPPLQIRTEQLEREVELYIEARDYYRQQAESWQQIAENWPRGTVQHLYLAVLRKLKFFLAPKRS